MNGECAIFELIYPMDKKWREKERVTQRLLFRKNTIGVNIYL